MSKGGQTWSDDAGSGDEPPSEDDAPHPPEVDGFDVVALIGRGGMGEVWSVVERALDRTLALKIIRADLLARPTARERFLAEARATAALEHAGIAPVHQVGTAADGRPWYTMRELSGRTLADEFEGLATRVDRRDQLPRLVGLLVAVCDCLAYAHARGLVHRDVKPENVLVGAFGEVTVLDWGLVKPATAGPGAASAADPDASPEGEAPPSAPVAPASAARGPSPRGFTGPERGFRTRVGGGVGTPGFMAPEQAFGRPLGPPADVYALAATLVCLLTGEPPLASVAESIARADLPGALSALCERSLHPDPGVRPKDAGEFGRELAAWLDGARLAARRSEGVERAEAAWRGAAALERAVQRELLLRLVDGERQPRGLPRARLRQLCEGCPGALDSLLRAGVVREEAESVVLAEPAMLAEWPRLAAWIDAEGEGLRLRDRLHDVVPLDAPPRDTLDAGELASIRAWMAAASPVVSAAELAWIARSEAVERSRRWRRGAGVVATVVLSIAAAVVMAFLSRQAQQAQHAAQAASIVSEARALVAHGRELEGQRRPHEALALFLAADALDVGSAAADVARVASLGVRSMVIPAHHAGAWEVVWADDQQSLYSGGADGWIDQIDVSTGAILQRLGPHGLDVLQVAPWSGGLASWGFFHPVHVWRPGVSEPTKLDTRVRAAAGLRLVPGGTRMLTADRFGLVRLWDLPTATALADWQSPDGTRIFRSAVSADGRYAALGSAGGLATVVELPDLRELSRGPVGSQVVGVDFVGDEAIFIGGAGHWVALGLDGGTRGPGRLPGVTEAGNATVAPQGVVVAHDGSRVSIFDPFGLALRHELVGHSGRAEPSSFAADGARLATASSDEAILWSTATAAPLALLEGSTGPVKRARFSADGARIATASLDGTVRLWTPIFADVEAPLGPGAWPVEGLVSDAATGAWAVRQGEDCSVFTGAWLPPVGGCARVLAVAGEAVATLGSNGRVRRHRASAPVAEFEAPGGLLWSSLSIDPPRWVTSFRDGTIVTFYGPDFAAKHAHRTARDVTAAVAFAASNRVVRSSASDGPELVDATDGRAITALPVELGAVFYDTQLRGSDLAGEAAVARVAGGATRFALSDGAARPALVDSTDKTLLVEYAPDGRRLALSGYDRVLRVYALPAGDLEFEAGPFEGVLQGGVFSADGVRFALDTDQGVIRVFDLSRRTLLRTIRDTPALERPLAFLPDGRLAAVGAAKQWRAWSLDGEGPAPWSLTNFRVCRRSQRTVAVVPFPMDESPWAPAVACDDSAR